MSEQNKTEHPKDICYCTSPDCPYHDCCEQSATVLKGENGIWSFSNLSGVCRRYVGWLVHKLDEEE